MHMTKLSKISHLHVWISTPLFCHPSLPRSLERESKQGLNISLTQPCQTTAPQSQRGSWEDSVPLSGSSSQPGLRLWVGWNGRSGPSEWQPFIVVRNGEVWSWSVAMRDRGRRRKKRERLDCITALALIFAHTKKEATQSLVLSCTAAHWLFCLNIPRYSNDLGYTCEF